MDLPAPLLSEQALKRHVSRLLAKNTSTEDAISFLGAGCYKRYIPAVCDEIANRSEFLTAYCGDTYSDHGKMQAIFEYASMMAELLELDVVSYPTYDAGQAVSSSFRMALRLRPGRNEILVPARKSAPRRPLTAAPLALWCLWRTPSGCWTWQTFRPSSPPAPPRSFWKTPLT